MRHELIDIRDPSEAFSVGDFVRLADEACERITAEGALPVLSGGTAYYIKAFLYGSPPAPPADAAVRAALQEELAERGPAALRAELARVDPKSAARLAPADLYRITRALEVYRCSGRPLSSFTPPTEPRPRWNPLVVGLDRPRAELYARIDARVEAMLAAGLADEVQALRAAGFSPGDPGLRAIGYAEFLAATPDQHGNLPLESIAADIKMHTRRYAKRQLTFMRSLPDVHWFSADDYEALFELVAGWLLKNP
jgi:tRNA dimethylallyltransferase